MGLSVPAAFAVIVTAALVSFGLLYTSGESAYSMIHEAGEDYNQMVLRAKTAELALSSYNYTTDGTVLVYDMTFNLTNEGTTLSPARWAFIYDGRLDDSAILISGDEYLLPGDSMTVTVQNIPKVELEVHSLVISTEVGCALKVKWEWVGNRTNGSPRVVGSAWYCPVEG
ncbi:hypothetical protein [Thermococcus camini]|uniref:Putative flagella-related protein n=1 Tax=Thermococcus camini TaxID=2016373 RepID=A0A7G2DC74_9EURY|nr:hypothetical protein [Thermococcus camini]CAD5244570.1 putative flagella-related protein [Thermococcus camini]